jgi:hypothetical protein
MRTRRMGTLEDLTFAIALAVLCQCSGLQDWNEHLRPVSGSCSQLSPLGECCESASRRQGGVNRPECENRQLLRM